MLSTPHAPGGQSLQGRAAGPGVKSVAWLVAAWCVGFALVNLVYEVTDHFAGKGLDEYATGIAVMSWTVFVLKLLGATVAVMSVGRLPTRVSPALIGLLVWGAAALLGVYSLGSVVEAIGIVTGVMGSADDITPASVAYVVFFLLGALGYGVLAISFSRRYAIGRRVAIAGFVGAPVVLALILLAIPTILASFGLMPE